MGLVSLSVYFPQDAGKFHWGEQSHCFGAPLSDHGIYMKMNYNKTELVALLCLPVFSRLFSISQVFPYIKTYVCVYWAGGRGGGWWCGFSEPKLQWDVKRGRVEEQPLPFVLTYWERERCEES